MAKFIKWFVISIVILIVIAVIISFIIAFKLNSDFKRLVNKIEPVNFETCAFLGNPVSESYPRQCRAGEKIFTEDVGNLVEKADLIKLTTPKPNEPVTSPLKIEGEARGYWFFEASFPVRIWDANGKELGVGIAQAQGEWMTENFVPFKAVLEFKPAETKTGLLILEKENPSGLPEKNDSLRIPIRFQ